MILRKQPNGELVLIGQTDHSRLAGQLAAHWGNSHFAAPDPYDSMVRAATFHDYGWLRYETSPLINTETGEPFSFLQVPLGSAQLASYQWSLDWMTSIDPYAGLIINMHRTGLWQHRYDALSHPNAYTLTEMSAEVRDLVKRNEAWQEQARIAWDQRQLDVNYRLMQIWDFLALYLCCDEPYEEYVEPVPISYAEKDDTRMTIKPAGPSKIAFDPYPFNMRPCSVQLMTRRLPKSSYGSVEEFQRDYFGGQIDLCRFELC
jgi:Protein of unknown function (DUF3891)